MLVLHSLDHFVDVILLESETATIVAFVDEEDYDYLLHVHKVLANPERRGLVWLDRG